MIEMNSVLVASDEEILAAAGTFGLDFVESIAEALVVGNTNEAA